MKIADFLPVRAEIAVSAALAAGFMVMFSSRFFPEALLSRFVLGAGAGLALVSVFWIVSFLWLALHRFFARFLLDIRMLPPEASAILTDYDGSCLAWNDRAKKAHPELQAGIGIETILNAAAVLPENFVERQMGFVEQKGAFRQRLGSEDNAVEVAAVGLRWHTVLWTFSEIETAHDAVAKIGLPCVSVSGTGQVTKLNDEALSCFGMHEHLNDILADPPFRPNTPHIFRGANESFTGVAAELNTGSDTREIAIVRLEESSQSSVGTMLSEPGLLEALPVPMLKISAEGNLLEVNREARTVLGLNECKLPALFELVEGLGRPISEWLGDAVMGRGLLKPEIVRAVIPGQELFLQITLGRAFEDGEVVLVGILNDATELKTLEAQFVQSQKMQAIGQLAGGVAHDFNNLLTAISGHCDLLLLRHDAGDPEYADLIQISQNANRAASLVGQLLAFSRKQNLKPRTLDLRDTMSDLAHLLNRLIGERIQLDVQHGAGPQTIRADRRQLEQVLINLVVNARDAMPDGGMITVATRRETLTETWQRDRARIQPGDYVVIEVRDTGTGISTEGLSKIFEPFYTTKKTGEGTGLGLSTAYGIVKQTGGFIFAESEPGTGSVFTLVFPVSTISEPKPEQISQSTDTSINHKEDGVVLLVEDEAPVRAFASRALKLRGYTVIEAECAEDALGVLEDEALEVDIFVTDVIMPGMDGPTWVRKALKKRPDTRVVFVSGYAEEGRAEKQSRIPNSVFLAKPFSLQDLTSLVHEQLH